MIDFFHPESLYIVYFKHTIFSLMSKNNFNKDNLVLIIVFDLKNVF